jgi:hypothetical protein
MLPRTAIVFSTCLFVFAPILRADEDEDAKKERLRAATEHMQLFELQSQARDKEVPLIERPLLIYGDSARQNENGTLWAWGQSGRPLALVELYQRSGGESWIHALTLTSAEKISLKTTIATKWQPDSLQVQPQAIPDAPRPAAKEAQRLRQVKELARRFAAHEFWDPDNSRFELRLLVQPVLRYSDADDSIQDGALFVLAHGTNPEVLLFLEATGKSVEESHWHCGFARLGSAEMHVELDGKEVWKVDRAQGVVGKPIDPYWLFTSPAN